MKLLSKKKIFLIFIYFIGCNTALSNGEIDAKGFPKKMTPHVQFSIFNEHLVVVDSSSSTPNIWTNLQILEEIIAGKYTRLVCGQEQGNKKKVWWEEIRLAIFLKEELTKFLKVHKKDWQQVSINQEDIYVFKKTLFIDGVKIALHIDGDHNLYLVVQDPKYQEKKYKTVAKNEIVVNNQIYAPPQQIQDIYTNISNSEDISPSTNNRLTTYSRDEVHAYNTLLNEIQTILYVQYNYMELLIHRCQIFIENTPFFLETCTSRDALIDRSILQEVKVSSLREGKKIMNNLHSKILEVETHMRLLAITTNNSSPEALNLSFIKNNYIRQEKIIHELLEELSINKHRKYLLNTVQNPLEINTQRTPMAHPHLLESNSFSWLHSSMVILYSLLFIFK